MGRIPSDPSERVKGLRSRQTRTLSLSRGEEGYALGPRRARQFQVASDGHGATIVSDPPVDDAPATNTMVATGAAAAFVFPADFGSNGVNEFATTQAAGANYDQPAPEPFPYRLCVCGRVIAHPVSRSWPSPRGRTAAQS